MDLGRIKIIACFSVNQVTSFISNDMSFKYLNFRAAKIGLFCRFCES